MNIFIDLLKQNWDLLTIGTVISMTVMLAFVVYFSSHKRAVHKAFLGFSLSTAVWGTFNFLSYHAQVNLLASFHILRAALFFATWMTFFLFLFAVSFPKEDIGIPKILHRFLWLWTAFISLLTTSPLVLSSVKEVSPDGMIVSVTNGIAMPLFGITTAGFALISVVFLVAKTIHASAENKSRFFMITSGVAIMVVSLFFSNFLLPVMYDNSSLLPLAALFVFPFIAFTSYAIIRYRLLNVHIMGTEIFISTLLLINLTQLMGAVTFGDVLVRLVALFAVVSIAILVVRSVLAVVEQREKIQQLAVELEMSNEQLSEFMSLATHEIRNPATFIRGYTAGALEGDVGELSPLIRDGMQKLYVRANDIIHLGNQYLNKSKLELNRISFDFVPTDIHKVIDDLVHEFEPAAAQQGITVASHADAGVDYTIPVDAGKIKEVFANIIDNSIKYTPKGSVTVSLSRSGTGVKVQVSDTGVGIPEEVIPKLFKKFSRADAQKANILGTGLGLYISKIFVDAHSGTITVTSEGKGKGSIFTVELPLTQPTAVTPPKPLAERVESGMLKTSPEA